MTCATGLCGVVDEGTAGTAELVVEHDGGGERGEPGAQAGAEVVEGASAVAFEGEDVLGSPEDRFDSLSDRREVRAATFLVLAARPEDGCVELGELGFEVLAAEVLV